MALINFKNLPDTSTPLNAENLNNNFNELNNNVEKLEKKVETVSNNALIKYKNITIDSPIGSGGTYQLDLPKNTLGIQLRVKLQGGNSYVGPLIVPGSGFSYIICNDANMSTSGYIGFYASVTEAGLLSASSYTHNGKEITGVRIFYQGEE